MIELFALALYGVQWLGVSMGVGAQTVILVAHLLMLHEKKHPWLSHVPGARGAQAFGLFLMVASGVGAIAVHLFAGSQATLWQPAFGFKWMLIILLWGVYRLERSEEGKLQALREGFAGATWFALFLVHTLAPITSWANLFALYILWLLAFGAVWGSFVALMAYAGRPKEIKKAEEVEMEAKKESVMIYHNTPPSKVAPKVTPIKVAQPKVAPVLPIIPKPQPPIPPPVTKPAPMPAPKPATAPLPKIQPAPASVPAPAPVAAAVAHSTPPVVHEEPKPRVSVWQRLKKLFARKPHPAPAIQKPAAAPMHAEPKVESKPAPAAPIVPKQPLPAAGQIPSAPVWPLKRDIPPPVPVQSHVPAVAHLEIEAPHSAVAEAPAAPAPAEKKEPNIDYRDLPAIQIMPQKPEEVANRNRGPVVNLEDSIESGSKDVASALRDL